MLWRDFGASLPGSEIVRDLSENDFCSRTSERAEKTWSKKSGLPCFFFSPRMKGKVQKSVMFVEDEAKSVASDTGPHRNVGVGTSVHLTSVGARDVCYMTLYTNPEEAPQRES